MHSAVDRCIYKTFRRPVVMAVNAGPFGKFILFKLAAEFLIGKKEIMSATDLALSWRTGSRTDRINDLRHCPANGIDQCCFARSRWCRKNKYLSFRNVYIQEQPQPVQVLIETIVVYSDGELSVEFIGTECLSFRNAFSRRFFSAHALSPLNTQAWSID